MAFLPEIKHRLFLDAEFAFESDPAAISVDEIILCYPGFYAIAVYRLSHELYLRHLPILPRMISECAHSCTGIDIHPGATIGTPFFIDHGTGVVIGETAVIGNRVKIYQGVTIGAKSIQKNDEKNKKRHPTISNNCVIYAGATIPGAIDLVSQTFPPTVLPSPINVSPPRMVAPAYITQLSDIVGWRFLFFSSFF